MRSGSRGRKIFIRMAIGVEQQGSQKRKGGFFESLQRTMFPTLQELDAELAEVESTIRRKEAHVADQTVLMNKISNPPKGKSIDMEAHGREVQGRAISEDQQKSLERKRDRLIARIRKLRKKDVMRKIGR